MDWANRGPTRTTWWPPRFIFLGWKLFKFTTKVVFFIPSFLFLWLKPLHNSFFSHWRLLFSIFIFCDKNPLMVIKCFFFFFAPKVVYLFFLFFFVPKVEFFLFSFHDGNHLIATKCFFFSFRMRWIFLFLFFSKWKPPNGH